MVLHYGKVTSVLLPLTLCVISIIYCDTMERQLECFAIGIVSFLAYTLSLSLIGPMRLLMLEKGLFGIDLLKTSNVKVPEALGIVTGSLLILSVLLLQPLFAGHLQVNAATTAITLTVLTGFLDDVLDLRWKTKIALSFFATLPLLVAYNGPTNVVVPVQLRAYLGDDLQLYLGYFVYMLLLSVFFTNSINIYAGINGLEVGQSVVIAVSVVIHNILQIPLGDELPNILSIAVALPFLSSSLALLRFNWYPARLFVGDTYTYTAGMTFAVCAIISKNSKTVMLFFIPQILNFVMSMPQLFKKLPCPRHRVPKYVANTDKLHYSTIRGDGTGLMNLTLINLVLFLFGDMHEETLVKVLLAIQVACSCLAFFIRYYVAGFFY